MKKMHILLLGALPILLLFVTCAQDTPTSVSPSAVQTDITLAKNSNIDAFDMVDAFSGSGASGNGFVKVIDGQMDLTIHARSLVPNTSYDVRVAVGGQNVACNVINFVETHIFPVTSDKNGKFTFRVVGFDLGLDPGQYRIDYVVNANFVLACRPASCVTIN